MKKIIVFYHKNCPDGFGAAWSAWMKFKNKADYVSVEPGLLPGKPIRNKTIYFLDNCPKTPALKTLLKTNKKVIVVDHHSGNKEDVVNASESFFDLKRSAAVLSWIYFHPGKKIPKLLLHIEDMDLWKFKIKNTHEIISVVSLLGYDSFSGWSKLTENIQDPAGYRKEIEKGRLLQIYDNKLIDRIAKSAQLVSFAGIKTLAINSPLYQSELGHILYKKMPPIGIVWRIKDDVMAVSLRSDGSVDVSKLAGRFGGGGHKASAGFTIKASARFPWKILKK